uniref:Uncharacterized protein n=1 Tax=Ditylenchus dipsaci TaxID=166011 RepID=A0A915ECI7_9BILA
MKTQLGNQDQADLEMKEMRQKLDLMRRELDSKSEKIGRKELKERELIITTTNKVRKELELEFAEEIAKIQKELRIQNLAQVEANQQIVRKVQNDLQKKEKEKEAYKVEALKAVAEIESCQRSLRQYENEKKKFESVMLKSKQQSEKLVMDSRRQMEEIEKSKTKETGRLNEIVTAIKKENTDLKKESQEMTKELTDIKQNFNCLKKEFEQKVQKHNNQNLKLGELRQFLKYVLEDKSDKYIDSVMGEDRNAIFTKLLLLLKTVPGV